ncbi:hypothetical protein [Pseudoxanthomonas mexicana]|uniref:hypothetical protein n=1 Tax=Pseudoxanthomonas mexicana TaxID=128785 RepID=UPI0028A0795E|nr:hypothetical protein [Pseudoxanthomonas mexicana]
MEMDTKQDLRSKRGRPKGSFRDPALRAQAWHWLSELLLATGETDPRRFDDVNGAHRLSRGLPVGRRFTRVMEDGYDPRNISAGKFQLFDHVKKSRKFPQATAAYGHPLFKYMQDRELGPASEPSWIRERMRTYGLALMPDLEHQYARAFGLAQAGYTRKEAWAFRLEEESPVADLEGQWEKLVSLDGLHLLVALHRLVIDTTPDATEYESHLAKLISRTALQLSERYGYGPEQHDTWRLLVATRLTRWIPVVRITDDELNRAMAELEADFARSERSAAGRPKLGPHAVSRGRAERRWRRWAYVRAALKRLESYQFPWVFVARTDGTDWIEENSERIREHLKHAMNRDSSAPRSEASNELAPISMPMTVHRLRRSPRETELFLSWKSQYMDDFIVIE